MVTEDMLISEIETRIEKLTNLQLDNGSWKFCFEGGLMTDAFMIFTLRSLQIKNEEVLIKKLADRIIHLQSEGGTWKAYPDEKDGNLSSTVQAYTALLYSGLYFQDHPSLKKAEIFIKNNGGISKTHFMTKWMLAVHGLYQWPTFFYIPMTFLLLPKAFPINFFQLSSYARIHLIPMMIAANKKFTLHSKNTPNIDHLTNRSTTTADLSQWDMSGDFRLKNGIVHEMNKLHHLPNYLHRLGYERAERYILKRIEHDGTLYSYASATFFMIYALFALGYKKESPIIKKAINGLKRLITEECDGIHLENSTSTVWDTALISYALQEANIPAQTSTIKKANQYLLSKQHSKKGDWSIHNPSIDPGCWGFSDNNTINPDNDDTSAALRAITRGAMTHKKLSLAWYKGVIYLLSMQNADGGWAAFEKNTDFKLLTYLPLDNSEDAAIDPSTADLTGRTLEFLGNYANISLGHPSIKAAVRWLVNNQEKDGSWYGRWGVCYIYGTWAAITGLISVGMPVNSPTIKRAIKWLEAIQLSDGGWGESCKSSVVKGYIPLHFSTPSQTSWALDAIIQSGGKKRDSVKRGLTWLLQEPKHKNSLTYPTGIGLPGQFYINYHSYNQLFPLLTLAHYLQKG